MFKIKSTIWIFVLPEEIHFIVSNQRSSCYCFLNRRQKLMLNLLVQNKGTIKKVKSKLGRKHICRVQNLILEHARLNVLIWELPELKSKLGIPPSLTPTIWSDNWLNCDILLWFTIFLDEYKCSGHFGTNVVHFIQFHCIYLFVIVFLPHLCQFFQIVIQYKALLLNLFKNLIMW